MKLSEFQVAILLRYMKYPIEKSNPNQDGFALFSAQYREDKHPSVGIHIPSGSFVDHATGERGNVFDLIKKHHGLNDFSQALDKAREILNQFGSSRQYSQATPTFSSKSVTTSKESNFWDEDKKDLRDKSHQRLLNEPDHPLIEAIARHDQITYDTLKKVKCGIYRYRGEDYLLIPYRTGAQLYRRSASNKKVIRSLPGSKPKRCFWNIKSLDGSTNLHITKSPREGMLLTQCTNEDTISIATGENAGLSQEQGEILRGKCQPGQRIFIYFDCDTEDAKNNAYKFAYEVKQALPTAEVFLINIHSASKGTAKDLADWIRAGYTHADLNDYIEELPIAIKFWEIRKNGSINLQHSKIIQLCEKAGFGKLYLGDEPILIWNQNGVLRHSSQSKLLDYIRNVIESIPAHLITDGDSDVIKAKILEAFFRKSGAITGPSSQQLFKPLDIDFITDTESCIRLFFKNGVVEITETDVHLKPYKDLDGAIWHEQIIDHEIELDAGQAHCSVFGKFIDKVSDGASKRKAALVSTFGYLTSTYKDPANAKAIVLVDEEITGDNEAEGGTGKSLFSTALKYVRKLKYIPGKDHSPTHRFAYQAVQLGDQILFIDDVRPNYNFEGLFNIITNDMHVECKGEGIIRIPFDLSPKIVLSTNTSIGGSGNSFERRQNVIEFSNYFDKHHTPMDEFGQRLFDDWDSKEWNRFYNYTIWCAQQFLAHGLSSFTKNYKLKKLINETSREMVEFYREEVKLNKQYDKKDLFHKYQRHNTDAIPMSQGAFTSQIKKCADLDNRVYKTVEKKYGAQRTITFWTQKRYQAMIKAKNKDEDDEE